MDVQLLCLITGGSLFSYYSMSESWMFQIWSDISSTTLILLTLRLIQEFDF